MVCVACCMLFVPCPLSLLQLAVHILRLKVVRLPWSIGWLVRHPSHCGMGSVPFFSPLPHSLAPCALPCPPSSLFDHTMSLSVNIQIKARPRAHPRRRKKRGAVGEGGRGEGSRGKGGMEQLGGRPWPWKETSNSGPSKRGGGSKGDVRGE